MNLPVIPFEDILGELFMALDINSVRSGQFFTPGPVAEMMARMQFDKDNFLKMVEEKGEVTICDPAVGSGVMLLAFGKVIASELGREHLRYARFYGNDIDLRCVLMTRIQIRMNGMDRVGRMANLLAQLDQAPASPPPINNEAPALPVNQGVSVQLELFS